MVYEKPAVLFGAVVFSLYSDMPTKNSTMKKGIIVRYERDVFSQYISVMQKQQVTF
ncbi:hypothetical protein CUS_5477 [Ruminococcus albus 8]|uniref:Uncharacterized protein n=1 Tax=Ruminococcus albus 8 TaxID=246199 RepID=E9SBJ8_RUMAL|nr:hypothetical protein CUS_5477 [Ruminococcus albus 8]